MSFTPNIPASGQSLGSSRLQVLNNFSNYNTVVGIDHIAPYPTSAYQGEHKKVTLNTFGSASYAIIPAAPDRSFISSYNASTAGSQLVYQPSIVNFFVPATPRSLARITKTGASTFALGNGPYGASTNFNASTPTFLTGNSCTYNFTNALTTADYFVFATIENLPSGGTAGIGISDKTTAGFTIRFGSGSSDLNWSAVIMVF